MTEPDISLPFDRHKADAVEATLQALYGGGRQADESIQRISRQLINLTLQVPPDSDEARLAGNLVDFAKMLV